MTAKLSISLVLALVAWSLGSAAAGGAIVNASCNPNRANQVSSDPANNWYNQKWRNQSPTVEAIASTLSNYTPYVANVTPPPPSTNSSAVVAWIGLHEVTGLHAPGFVQLGWLQKKPGSSPIRQTFVQSYHWAGGDYDNLVQDYAVYGAPWPYPYVQYEIRLWNSKFEFYVAGQKSWTSTPYFIPKGSVVAGETTTLSNQMPGGSANKMTFINTTFKSNNVSYPLNPNVGANNSPTPQQWYAEIGDIDPQTGYPIGYIVNMWDVKCSS